MKVVKCPMMILAFLLLVSMVSISSGAGGGKVTYRPLSDWLLNNSSNFDFYSSLYYAMIQDHSGDPMSVLPDGVIGTTELYGYVMERALRDGRAELTVHLHAKNAPLTLYSKEDMFDWFPPSGPPDAILGYGTDGSIDYYFSCKFILPTPGQVIPNLASSLDVIITICIAGSGHGTFTDYAASFGFTPGKQGTLQVTQMGLFSAASKADQQGALSDAFPVELVTIHQLG